MLNLLREMLNSPALEVIQRLKYSTGMPVRALSTAMQMSYMGVKQHCVELEKAGFLDTWRKAKGAGRPEKWYRLTPKAVLLLAGGRVHQVEAAVEDHEARPGGAQGEQFARGDQVGVHG